MLAVERGVNPRWVTDTNPEIGDGIIRYLEDRAAAATETATRAELRRLIGVGG